MKRSRLQRKLSLRSRPKHIDRTHPARQAWKEPVWGACAACDRVGWLVRHHCVYAQHLPEDPAVRYDLRNALPLGGLSVSVCACHELHHTAGLRLPLSLIPAKAWEFAIEVLGEETARAYFERRYAAEDRRAA